MAKKFRVKIYEHFWSVIGMLKTTSFIFCEEEKAENATVNGSKKINSWNVLKDVNVFIY